MLLVLSSSFVVLDIQKHPSPAQSRNTLLSEALKEDVLCLAHADWSRVVTSARQLVTRKPCTRLSPVRVLALAFEQLATIHAPNSVESDVAPVSSTFMMSSSLAATLWKRWRVIKRKTRKPSNVLLQWRGFILIVDMS